MFFDLVNGDHVFFSAAPSSSSEHPPVFTYTHNPHNPELRSTSAIWLQYENPDLGVSALDLKGYVVTYMSRVETFVTGIKIEKESRSRDQGNFQTANIKDQECVVSIQPLTCKTKRSRVLEGAIKHTLSIKNFDPGHKHFNRRHIGDYSSSCKHTYLLIFA